MSNNANATTSNSTASHPHPLRQRRHQQKIELVQQQQPSFQRDSSSSSKEKKKASCVGGIPSSLLPINYYLRCINTSTNNTKLTIMMFPVVFILILVIIFVLIVRSPPQQHNDRDNNIMGSSTTQLMVRVTERTYRKQVWTTNAFLRAILSRTTTRKQEDAGIVFDRWKTERKQEEAERRGMMPGSTDAATPCSNSNHTATTLATSTSSKINTDLYCNVSIPPFCAKTAAATNKTKIPKIIHQLLVPYDDLIAVNPALARIQNSWRSQIDWNYRTYTMKSASQFVRKHYSVDIYPVYHSLPPYLRSHLFKLLLLYKYGGIYADPDVLLELTSLNTLIPSSFDINFVTARQDVRNSNKNNDRQHHCLWTGFIGSSPKHPYLALAIKQFLSSRAIGDYTDSNNNNNNNNADAAASATTSHIEKQILSCRLLMTNKQYYNNSSSNDMQLKLRSIPDVVDRLWGSCLLGRAVNVLLGREALQEFHPFEELTLSRDDSDGGEQQHSASATAIADKTLMLMMSQDDTGAYRCSDINRNMLVASTHLNGVAATVEEGQKRASAATSTVRSWLRTKVERGHGGM